MYEITKIIKTQIGFDVQTEYGPYRSAIYVDEGVNIDHEAIDEEINRRVNNHIDAIKNPPAPPEISAEEQLALDEKYLQDLAIQKDEFERIYNEKALEVESNRIVVEAIIQERELQRQIIEEII